MSIPSFIGLSIDSSLLFFLSLVFRSSILKPNFDLKLRKEGREKIIVCDYDWIAMKTIITWLHCIWFEKKRVKCFLRKTRLDKITIISWNVNWVIMILCFSRFGSREEISKRDLEVRSTLRDKKTRIRVIIKHLDVPKKQNNNNCIVKSCLSLKAIIMTVDSQRNLNWILRREKMMERIRGWNNNKNQDNKSINFQMIVNDRLWLQATLAIILKTILQIEYHF
jgi:hypothetical protein